MKCNEKLEFSCMHELVKRKSRLVVLPAMRPWLAQVISHRLLTAQTSVQHQGIPHGICGGRMGTAKDFPL
jgi:hypothetical protein